MQNKMSDLKIETQSTSDVWFQSVENNVKCA